MRALCNLLTHKEVYATVWSQLCTDSNMGEWVGSDNDTVRAGALHIFTYALKGPAKPDAVAYLAGALKCMGISNSSV